MDRSGTSGILVFRHRESEERLAVMLGIHNYKMWSDILTNADCSFDRESAKDIRDSYYRDNGRGGMLWKLLNTTSGPLSSGQTVSVVSHATGKSGNSLQSDISIQ